MALPIEVESGLARFFPPIGERLGLPCKLIETNSLDRPARYLSVSVARSPHDQIVTYPAVECALRNTGYSFQLFGDPEVSAQLQSQSIELLHAASGVVSANYIFDNSGTFIGEFRGVTRESIWSLEFAYISHFENALRATYDLPLGASHSITFPWYLLEFAAPPHLDMVRPYLHLFAHDPRYRIVKLSEFTGYVAIAGDGDLASSAQHAVDYLEGVIDE